MELVLVVMMIALIEYMVFAGLVGRARAQYGVRAPATTGHPQFERVYRVHQNTLEALIIFVPALFVFACYLSFPWAAGLGVAFTFSFLVNDERFVPASPSSLRARSTRSRTSGRPRSAVPAPGSRAS